MRDAIEKYKFCESCSSEYEELVFSTELVVTKISPKNPEVA